MLLLNRHPDYRVILDVADADTLSVEAARKVTRRHRSFHWQALLVRLALARFISG